ncbi:MAG: class I SAM-dependent methyltransferase [Actinomycetota bacterium]|nr:class I SAM-dependent methyltransferase [Actinomycetota bacterium]
MKVPQKPKWMMWDHNIHYHRFLLQQIPPGAQRALDVGCGSGLFATRVAEKVPEVVAIDRDADMISTARSAPGGAVVQYFEADLLEADLPVGAFDFVSCLSALHHMPLRPGLERLGSLLAPHGVLAVLGLYKLATAFDYAYAAVTGLLDLPVGVVRHHTQAPLRRSGGVVADWHDTLREIRTAADAILPCSKVRRHMYDRYTLLYRKHA